MPRYRDKMRLKRLEHRVGEVDDFTRYLILDGYNEDAVAKGLEIFVETWETTVEWYKYNTGALGLCVEEFDHDVSFRSHLHFMMKKAPEDQIRAMRKRIERADKIFIKATEETRKPVFGSEDSDKEELWWFFRIPRDGLC